jgi:hypothetical protein
MRLQLEMQHFVDVWSILASLLRSRSSLKQPVDKYVHDAKTDRKGLLERVRSRESEKMPMCHCVCLNVRFDIVEVTAMSR